MNKIIFTREEFQTLLEENNLNANVTYKGRMDDGGNNVIIYYRLQEQQKYADNKQHICRGFIQITHYHKEVMDSIESFICNNFNAEIIPSQTIDAETDFYKTVYRVHIFLKGLW